MKDSITKLTKHLWVGGDMCYSRNLDRDMAIVNTVHVVLDVREEDERGDSDLEWETFATDRPCFIHHVMYDDIGSMNDWAMFHDIALLLKDAADKQNVAYDELDIFVHCHMGVNRAPSVAMFLLMQREGWDAEKAFLHIRAKRPNSYIAFAGEAVEAITWLTDELPDDEKITNWQKAERRYWRQNKDEVKRINDVIESKHRYYRNLTWKGSTHTDELGRKHGRG